jgi:tetratricopeptide (TPR) repeat protein
MHQWHLLLKQAEEAELNGDLARAEGALEQAVQSAQEQLGPYDTNLAKCLLAFAQFLEAQNRYGDAALRYKLAAAIYKRGGNTNSEQLAKTKADQMALMAHRQRPQ